MTVIGPILVTSKSFSKLYCSYLKLPDSTSLVSAGLSGRFIITSLPTIYQWVLCACRHKNEYERVCVQFVEVRSLKSHVSLWQYLYWRLTCQEHFVLMLIADMLPEYCEHLSLSHFLFLCERQNWNSMYSYVPVWSFFCEPESFLEGDLTGCG